MFFGLNNDFIKENYIISKKNIDGLKSIVYIDKNDKIDRNNLYDNILYNILLEVWGFLENKVYEVIVDNYMIIPENMKNL